MTHRGLVVIRVEVVDEVFRRNVTELRKEVTQVLRPAVILRDQRIDLGAVTRREDRSLEHVLVRRQVMQGLGQICIRDRELLEKIDRGRTVVEPDDDYRHRGKLPL
jgi:hypothetical protein